MARRQQPPVWVVLVVLLIAAGIAAYRGCATPPGPGSNTAGPGEYLFCLWNVENLFDDKDGEYSHEPDKGYDTWYFKNPEILREKLDHLSTALVAMNGGRGPDILAAVEVESPRAAELLKDAMNERLKDKPDLQYTTVLMKEVRVGRHIAPAVITRLPVAADRTQQWEKIRRILETHIVVDGHDLVLVPSHWTSRVSDEDGKSRAKYADLIYGRYRAMQKSNPDVDFLVCGDFNDTPEDPSVKKHLHASGERDAIRASGGEQLFAVLAGHAPEEFGTHAYGRKWFIFDQIVVSLGMLDQKGWSCDPTSVTVVREGLADKKGRPIPFGNPPRQKDEQNATEPEGRTAGDTEETGPKGYSDHFPVTVRLTVHGGER
jgi:endonuclease/exonuclease/phosphatase family metal-dependent hydrolase